MDIRLDDQVAFIAGSSRGIGRAIASMLLDAGARVTLTGRDAKDLESARSELALRAGADRVLAIPCDLTGRVAIDDALDRTITTFGRLDHMIANVGSGAGPTGWDIPEDEWDRLFELNFFAAVRLAQAALRRLSAGGSLVFIASIVALEATGAPLPYSAAKAALVNYAKNLGARVGPSQIRVNTVAPGNIVFDGGSWERRRALDPEAVAAMLANDVPLGRFGVPEEVASLVTYLCSPLAAFATGGCYVVDGGQTRTF